MADCWFLPHWPRDKLVLSPEYNNVHSIFLWPLSLLSLPSEPSNWWETMNPYNFVGNLMIRDNYINVQWHLVIDGHVGITILWYFLSMYAQLSINKYRIHCWQWRSQHHNPNINIYDHTMVQGTNASFVTFEIHDDKWYTVHLALIQQYIQLSYVEYWRWSHSILETNWSPLQVDE